MTDELLEDPDSPPRPKDRNRPASELLAAGKALRDKVLRQAQAQFHRNPDKVDPIAILQAGDVGRIDYLVPIRYGRMLQSPFTFYRGSAAIMAADLARTASIGLRLQSCGDCHLMNFGGFATPERNVLLDINDFDETLPAPWEWDIKRLVTSFVLAARSNGFRDSDARDTAIVCARSYREHMRDYSEMSPLEVWYSRVNASDVLAIANKEQRKRIEDRIEKAMSTCSSEMVFPKLTVMVGGKVRIEDTPPLIHHPSDVSSEEYIERMEFVLNEYRKTLSEDRRELLDRYRLVDGAIKVVGIGSVGTMCFITLMMSANNEPLFLQWKEARQSVLEPYAGKSAYDHHGKRVVLGQRLMQPATDVFLGWTSGMMGRQGYVRQLRDAKIKPLVETMDLHTLTGYAEMCGWVLARAHAKAENSELEICGYLGKSDKFDEAMGAFAVAYADQAERDHEALKVAVRAGRIAVEIED